VVIGPQNMQGFRLVTIMVDPKASNIVKQFAGGR
jgi:hypothetical protein